MNLQQVKDPHSYYVSGEPQMTHLALTLHVDFDTHTLCGSAKITFNRPGKTTLDSRALNISSVEDSRGKPIDFTMGEPDNLLGTALYITVPEDKKVTIKYATSPEASGVKWLDSSITGTEHPMMFTQGEAIHARSYIPCQDTPSIKFTTYVTLSKPQELRALMGASVHVYRSETTDTSYETWENTDRIPAYLVAFMVGEFKCKVLSERSNVFAIQSVIHDAAAEFDDYPDIMKKAERLLGTYPWKNSSILVMPPSFPYGGMENPCLSFVNPSVITGDKSGVTTVIHELAHSWTGNLITNATWRDFWLNEGWTVYAEYRITEEVFGTSIAELNFKLLELEFQRDVQIFRKEGRSVALSVDCTGIDPDDIFSRIPYFKGALFLIWVEQRVGRERFDPFIHKYMNTFAFASLTTEEFVHFLLEHFGEFISLDEINVWMYEDVELPDGAPIVMNSLIQEILQFATTGSLPAPDVKWGTMHQQLYLESLPRVNDVSTLEAFNERFHASTSGNAEIRYSFLMAVLESAHYHTYLDSIDEFLSIQGRMKYLKPIYGVLFKHEPERAREIFAKYRGRYHPITIGQVEPILNV